MAGAYEAAFEKFRDKYGVDYNIAGEYELSRKLSSLDAFTIESTPEERMQNSYKSMLGTAITYYLENKVRLEGGKKYDMTDVNIGEFINEFDNVMRGVLTDYAEKEGEKYEHKQYVGLSFNDVATAAWGRASGYNRPLADIWASQIRKGTLSLDSLQRITQNSTNMLDSMIESRMNYTNAVKSDLASVVMAKNTLEAAKNQRSWISWLNPFNWGPYGRENAYLKELNGKINTYRENNFPVDNVVPAMYAGNMLEGALSELQNTYGVRHQPTQNTATAVKTNKKVAVQQNIKAPSVKLTSMDEALAHYNENNMQENLRAEIEGIFANVNHPFKKLVFPGMPNNLKQQIMPHWITFEKSTTNQAKEEDIKGNTITLLKMLDVNLYGITSQMEPKDRIVALQKVANVFMRNFSPATSDVKYYKYLDNYFVQNAPLEEIQNIIGNEADVNAVMESACKELGVEKTKVYLPELSNNKDELKNSDKIEKISPVSKEKTIN